MSVTLKDVSLEIAGRPILVGICAAFQPGMMTVIMGPSGAGKSTLLGVISGHLRVDAGEVLRPTMQGGVDWLVQSTPLLQKRSVIDNVRLAALLKGLSLDEATARALRALSAVGVAHLARHPAYALSGGEKQRVAVARAIVSRAHTILADEPTASLDMHTRASVVSALKAAARAGAIVIVATHDPYVAGEASELLRLDGGILTRGSL